MKLRSVFSVLPTRVVAAQAIRDLIAAGFGLAEISLLSLASGEAPALLDPAPPEETSAVTVPLDVPGMGPLVVTGLIAAALKGTSVVSLADGLLDFGVPGTEAGQYEEAIRGGGTLVAVHSSNGDKTDRARTLFLAAGATLVRTLSTVTTPRTRTLTPLPRRMPTRVVKSV
jgi:hypothetical protein